MSRYRALHDEEKVQVSRRVGALLDALVKVPEPALRCAVGASLEASRTHARTARIQLETALDSARMLEVELDNCAQARTVDEVPAAAVEADAAHAASMARIDALFDGVDEAVAAVRGAPAPAPTTEAHYICEHMTASAPRAQACRVCFGGGDAP